MKNRISFVVLLSVCACGALWSQAPSGSPAAQSSGLAIAAPGSQLAPPVGNKLITEADCVTAKLGTTISISAIGEPVSAVSLRQPVWTPTTDSTGAYCSVDGAMSPVDRQAPQINFRVILPASWSTRSAQIGGGGMNGSIPNLLANPSLASGPTLVQRGFATYGSDSGHQSGPSPATGRGPGGNTGRGEGTPPSRGSGALPGGLAASDSSEWALNDEAIKNLGYMQLKKTHDAAMVLIERVYGERPRFNYFFGNSQGGREALTVAQRYPADYDGVAANVPIVNFSSLMLAPEFIRIQEKPLANWVLQAKVNAIRGEFMRQCDKLDGLNDGIMNNYMACRAIFDMSQGDPKRDPWAGKRCPNNMDPNPADASANACLTDGQIATLRVIYGRYIFPRPLANGVKSFGMWVPTIDPSGSGLIANTRYRGQEGAAPDAPMHTHLGILGVTGFLMQNLNANPLDYVEGGSLQARREQISAILDSTNPDLTAFYQRGGKLIVVIGTTDTLASPGAQLDYYQSVIEKMGQQKVDAFARLFVLPQTNHGLGGSNYTADGDGKPIAAAPIPDIYDRVGVLIDWVEKNRAPGKSLTVTAGEKSLPMCSYPTYPKYLGGPENSASSYSCAAP